MLSRNCTFTRRDTSACRNSSHAQRTGAAEAIGSPATRTMETLRVAAPAREAPSAAADPAVLRNCRRLNVLPFHELILSSTAYQVKRPLSCETRAPLVLVKRPKLLLSTSVDANELRFV